MRCLCIFIVVIIFVKCKTENFLLKQEMATINYCNSKYVTDCYAITRRLKRGEPYKTNLTMTSRYLSDNNVTIRIVWFDTMPVELLRLKLCEISSIDWLFAYVSKYSNFGGKCPYEPRLYALYNLEFPPKNLPQRIMSLLKGKFYAKFYFLATKTEEILVESTIIFQTLQ